MNELMIPAPCSDTPANCTCHVSASGSAPRLAPRPTRDHLLELISRKNGGTRGRVICQADCSHCYAGHCGTSIGARAAAQA